MFRDRDGGSFREGGAQGRVPFERPAQQSLRAGAPPQASRGMLSLELPTGGRERFTDACLQTCISTRARIPFGGARATLRGPGRCGEDTLGGRNSSRANGEGSMQSLLRIRLTSERDSDELQPRLADIRDERARAGL